ncbi:transformation system protein [Campylobacter hepaticus]|uniref:Transformation system protein n=1 Tax=Campylobacter hepaticus TaxID=1813019 RepID=A0A424Z0F6_9BACT|nr:transformation system protein [Campylobacter hepaticus]MPV54466.1 transformation system protein [Campylobacter hepaticus]MPV61538.1 transformation system protein [Campylobacter hepaticus]MPV77455.1 transformation system protein [Campylobacter hepaticus]MPV78682.1 transformation system protein [Campylobacter hepaticus]
MLFFSFLIAQNDFEDKKKYTDFLKLQNPFINPTFEKLQAIKISAIMFDRVKIDDKWYKKGDSIDEAIISKIDTQEIKIQYDNLEFVIPINKNGKISIN